ncbi:hypothetical protein ScPMuIL_017155 [Solemya velum]
MSGLTAWTERQLSSYGIDFDKADKDKSGTLKFDEVLAVLKASGFRGSDEDAMCIFKELDTNKDSLISKVEFSRVMKKVPKVTMKEMALRRAFKLLDKDHSGFLTRDEIIEATKKHSGLDVSAEKIADLLLYLVKEDDDQKVNYEEFLVVFGYRKTGSVLRDVFVTLDKDKSGFLTKEELIAGIQSDRELDLKAPKIAQLLIHWCKDTKRINYDEFVRLWEITCSYCEGRDHGKRVPPIVRAKCPTYNHKCKLCNKDTTPKAQQGQHTDDQEAAVFSEFSELCIGHRRGDPIAMDQHLYSNLRNMWTREQSQAQLYIHLNVAANKQTELQGPWLRITTPTRSLSLPTGVKDTELSSSFPSSKETGDDVHYVSSPIQ